MNLYYITQRDYDAHPLPFYWFSISSEKLAWKGQYNRPHNCLINHTGYRSTLQTTAIACTQLYSICHTCPLQSISKCRRQASSFLTQWWTCTTECCYLTTTLKVAHTTVTSAPFYIGSIRPLLPCKWVTLSLSKCRSLFDNSSTERIALVKVTVRLCSISPADSRCTRNFYWQTTPTYLIPLF